MTAEIAVIGAQRPEVQAVLEAEFKVHNVHQEPDRAAALQPIAESIRAVVTNAMAGVPTEVIDVLPNLELAAIMGVGLEKTDVARAKERGITVTTTPVLYDDVSDLGIILAMNACRRIVQADGFVRSGQWLKGRYPPATKFSGKRAGILGYGRIGVALAKRLEAFGMTISYYDPLPKEGVPHQAFPSAKALAENVDILFLAAAGGQGAGHIVTAEILDALGPDGVFVNIARGWLVDEGRFGRRARQWPDRCCGPRRVRRRTEGARGSICHGQRGADPACRQQHHRNREGDGRLRRRQCPFLVRRQGGRHPHQLAATRRCVDLFVSGGSDRVSCLRQR